MYVCFCVRVACVSVHAEKRDIEIVPEIEVVPEILTMCKQVSEFHTRSCGKGGRAILTVCTHL